MATNAGEVLASFKADTSQYTSELIKLSNSQKNNLTAMRKQLDGFVAANEDALNEIVDSNGSLIKSYDSLSDQQKVLLRDYEKNVRKVATANNQLQITGRKLAKTNVETGQSFDQVGRSAGGVAIQISQFTGQVQGGTNALLALSQQAADIGYAFGGVGIAVGATVSLLAGLALAFQDTEETVASLNDQIDIVIQKYKLTAAQSEYLISLEKETIKTYEDKNKLKQEEADGLQHVIDSYDGYIKKLEEGIKLTDAEKRSYDAITVTIEEQRKKFVQVNAEIDTNNNFIQDATDNITRFGLATDIVGGKLTKNLGTAYADLAKELDEQSLALTRTSREQFIYNEVSKLATNATAEQTQAIRDQAGALYDEQQAIEDAAKDKRALELEDERRRREEIQKEKEYQNALLALKKAAIQAENQLELSGLTGVEALEETHRQELAAIDARYSEELKKTEDFQSLLRDTTERHQQELTTLTTEEANKRAEADKQAAQDAAYAQQQIYLNLADSIGDTFGLLADENEAFSKVAFVAQQASAFAQAIINAQLAYTNALANIPAPYNTVVATTALASGYAAAGIIAGTTIAGIAHDGMANIPSEGTYLLDKGERVVKPQDNQELSDFLQREKNGEMMGGNTTINAPVNVSGNVTDEAWFSSQLMKQRDVIYAAQRKSERENPSKRRR